MKTLSILWLIMALSGCVASVTPVATGGSKADGIVEMSYDYGPYTTPKVDHAAALKSAVRRCATWGYDFAEAFAGITSCSQPSGFGCNRFRVTTEYQCTHSGAAPTPAAPTHVGKANYREELRQIREAMQCDNGSRIVKETAESQQWELDCGDGETLQVRCFEDDCYLR